MRSDGIIAVEGARLVARFCKTAYKMILRYISKYENLCFPSVGGLSGMADV